MGKRVWSNPTPFTGRAHIRRLAAADLGETRTREKAPDGVLHALADLGQVIADLLGGPVCEAYAHGAHYAQQAPASGTAGPVQACVKEGKPCFHPFQEK